MAEFGLSEADSRAVSVRQPDTLSRVDANLRPKLRYLRDELFPGDTPQQFADRVVHNATFLSCSLENRIVPRFEYMKSLGMDLTAISVTSVLIYTDELFARYTGSSLSDYQAFKSRHMRVRSSSARAAAAADASDMPVLEDLPHEEEMTEFLPEDIAIVKKRQLTTAVPPTVLTSPPAVLKNSKKKSSAKKDATPSTGEKKSSSRKPRTTTTTNKSA